MAIKRLYPFVFFQKNLLFSGGSDGFALLRQFRLLFYDVRIAVNVIFIIS